MKKIRENKKAIFFSMLSLLLSSLFIVMYSHSLQVPVSNDIFIINTRVYLLDNYINTFEEYTKESINIVAYKTFEAMNREIADDGFFDSEEEVKTTFRECALNNNSILSSKCPGLEGSTLVDFLDRMVGQGRNIHINNNYTINSLSVSQETDHEHVDIILNITYFINDSYASWNITKILVINFPLKGIKDPYYYGNSNGNAERKMSFSPTYVGGTWDAALFTDLYNNGRYRLCRNCSSFLMRFANLTSESYCCGVESIVNASDVPAKDTSYVDRHYWANKQYSCVSGHYDGLYSISIAGLESTPYIDIESIIYYGIEDYKQEILC
ncbi:hypothetical protein JXB41_04545 [Candidatus Woesearchaeota archaeon]|nr:hypothetical protein [Candidatus Woesearchaeota archaeon]